MLHVIDKHVTFLKIVRLKYVMFLLTNQHRLNYFDFICKVALSRIYDVEVKSLVALNKLASGTRK